MARYSSDSDDDRRRKEKRSKSSRKRSRRSRSRSRERGRKSESYSKSSRSHRRRSRSLERRSRESSYDSYRSSHSRRSRNHRDGRSRSRSSSRSSEERHREKRTQDISKEQTKERIKEALNAVENKDDDILRSKEKKKRKEVMPSMTAIAQIESDGFVQQTFTSSASSKSETTAADKGGNDGLPFGTRVPSLDPPKIITTNATDDEGLFAAALLEDEETKMKRWAKKLAIMRNKILADSFEH